MMKKKTVTFVTLVLLTTAVSVCALQAPAPPAPPEFLDVGALVVNRVAIACVEPRPVNIDGDAMVLTRVVLRNGTVLDGTEEYLALRAELLDVNAEDNETEPVNFSTSTPTCAEMS